MNKKHETIKDPDLFYCFVNISRGTNSLKFFIVPSRLAAKYVKESHRLWLRASKKHKDSPMRVFRIGLKGEKYKVSMPSAERYENNWKFKS